jgi:thioredoxin-like negative regulator of GroEL
MKFKKMEAYKTGKFFLDFSAGWCMPCVRIAPYWQSLEEKHGEKIKFIKYDVDTDREVAMLFQIQAMPTFIAIIDGEEIGRVRGADKAGIDELLAKLL